MRQNILIIIYSITCFYTNAQNSNPYEIFGHNLTVKYETPVTELLYIKNRDINSEIKALAFDIENNKVKLLGFNDKLIKELKIEADQLLRWLSVDPHATSYPNMSPYNFVGNMPISAIDPDGKDIYILFYTNGNKRGDEMFRASVLTRQRDIEKSKGFDPARDKVVVLAVQNLATIQKQVNNVVETMSPKFGQTAEFGIWSHAALQGPTGTALTSSNGVDGKQMSLEGWAKINFNFKESGASANFYGCKTGVNSFVPDGVSGPLTQKWKEQGSFANQVSGLPNFENVTVSGQTSSAFPSMYTNYRQNSENGADNFINSESIGMTIFQRTYMVSGYKRSQDWNLNEQNVALPMQNNINGKTVGKSFQPKKIDK